MAPGQPEMQSRVTLAARDVEPGLKYPTNLALELLQNLNGALKSDSIQEGWVMVERKSKYCAKSGNVLRANIDTPMQTHVCASKGKNVARAVTKNHVSKSHVHLHGAKVVHDKDKQDHHGEQPRAPFMFKAVQPRGVILGGRTV